MKIAILGAGALGCYYGARLQESGQDISFIVRSEYGYLKEHGLQVKSLHGDISLPRLKAAQEILPDGLSRGFGEPDEKFPHGRVVPHHFAGGGWGFHQIAAQHAYGIAGVLGGNPLHDRGKTITPRTKYVRYIKEM